MRVTASNAREKVRAVLCALVLLLRAGSGAALAEDDANIAFLDGGTTTLAPNGAGAFEFDSPIKNSGKISGTPSFLLRSGQDDPCTAMTIEATIEKKQPASLEPNEIAIVHFKISNVKLPAVCYLELTTNAKNDGIVGRTVKQLKLSQKYATWTLIYRLVGCIIATVVTLLFVALLTRRQLFSLKIGSPAWEFATKSWFSTLTVAGGVVSAGIAISSLPELTVYASKSGYATLVLLLSLAVVAAPFFFLLIRCGKAEGNEVKYSGHVIGFFVACGVTLLSGLAQLAIFFLILVEIFRDYFYLQTVACVLTVVSGVALCWYCGYSMYLTIQLQKQEAKRISNNTAAPPETPQMPSWPLL